MLWSKVRGDQENTGLLADVRYRCAGKGLGACRQALYQALNAREHVLPGHVSRHSQDQVVGTYHALVHPVQTLAREVFGLEVRGVHLPADRVVAEHESVERAEGESPGIVVVPPNSLQLLSPPHLNQGGVEAGALEHVSQHIERHIEVAGQSVHAGEGGLSPAPERGADGVQLHEGVE